METETQGWIRFRRDRKWKIVLNIIVFSTYISFANTPFSFSANFTSQTTKKIQTKLSSFWSYVAFCLTRMWFTSANNVFEWGEPLNNSELREIRLSAFSHALKSDVQTKAYVNFYKQCCLFSNWAKHSCHSRMQEELNFAWMTVSIEWVGFSRNNNEYSTSFLPFMIFFSKFYNCWPFLCASKDLWTWENTSGYGFQTSLHSCADYHYFSERLCGLV